MFVHHVFFWLKDELSENDRKKFEKGVTALPKIKHISSGDVGKPSSTNRPVIERSYSYSLLLLFANKAAHDAYQADEDHQKFISECSHLWTRVLIYDSESIEGM